MWSWSAPAGTEHHRVWNQVVLPYARRLRQGIRDPRDADQSTGRAVPVAGDEQGEFVYHEDFRTAPRFIDDADIAGFTGLRWTGERLEIKPHRTATLTYTLESPFVLHDVRAAARGSGPSGALRLSLSADGRKWVSRSNVEPGLEMSLLETPGRDLNRFLVRVDLSGKGKAAAALEDLRITARVDPPAVPQIALTPGKDGSVSFTDDFRSQRYLHAGRVANAPEIKWVPGALRMFGKQGYANEASADYHFVCARPLRDVTVKLACAADKTNFGASVALSLSRDGATFLPAAATNTSGKDPFRGELSAALGEPAANEFWVRITLKNTCGAATKQASPTVERLTVAGR